LSSEGENRKNGQENIDRKKQNENNKNRDIRKNKEWHRKDTQLTFGRKIRINEDMKISLIPILIHRAASSAGGLYSLFNIHPKLFHHLIYKSLSIENEIP